MGTLLGMAVINLLWKCSVERGRGLKCVLLRTRNLSTALSNSMIRFQMNAVHRILEQGNIPSPITLHILKTILDSRVLRNSWWFVKGIQRDF